MSSESTTSRTNPPSVRIGIRCPACGNGRFRTTHTEPLPTGRIRRRKTCRDCGRRVLTFESLPHARAADR
jgi:transcriptional regulator NrdR family protein